MKPHKWTEWISTSDASRLTGKTRETCSRAARDLPAREGPGNSKLYDSRRLLQALYVGTDGPTYSEAMRLLTLSRTEQVKLQNEITRKERIPIDDMMAVNNEVEQAIAGIIKASGLPIEAVNQIFDQLRDIPNRLGWDALG